MVTTLHRHTIRPGKGGRTSLERQSGKAEGVCRRAGRKAKGSWTQQGNAAERGGNTPKRGGKI